MNNNPTILIADDDPLLRTLFSKYLRAQGYDVVESTSGREALKSIRKASVKPNIALLDVRMPMDGFLTCKTIRTDSLIKDWDIQVVLWSAGNNLQNRRRAARVGADLFIPKPITPKNLTITLQDAFLSTQQLKS